MGAEKTKVAAILGEAPRDLRVIMDDGKVLDGLVCVTYEAGVGRRGKVTMTVYADPECAIDVQPADVVPSRERPAG